MARGFRWQLVLFVLTLPIFAAAAWFRLDREIDARPAATPAQVATASATPSPASTPSSDAASAATGPPLPSSSAYREALVGEVMRLNPLFAHLNPVDRDISSLIFDGLFATNAYGAPVPRLAEALFISFDDLEYVVRLRDDALWQDGVPFSADDVIFTMKLLADPAYGAYSAAGRFWQTVETQKLGDDLIRFRLAQPLGSFPLRLTVGILPEHALRGASVSQLAAHPFNLSPIGTGPYQLDELTVDSGGSISSVRLGLSPLNRQRRSGSHAYHLRALEFRLYATDELALEAYRAKHVNSLANIGGRAQLLQLADSHFNTGVEGALQVLIMNQESPLLADRRMRRALSLSLDLPSMVAARIGGVAAFADSPLIPGMSAYAPDDFWRRYEPESAADLLEAARTASESDDADDGGDSSAETRLAYTLIVLNEGPLPQLAADIAIAWRELGLDIAVEALNGDAMGRRLRDGAFDMAIVEQRVGGDADVYRFWHPSQVDGGENYGHAAQDEIAQLLDTARRMREGIARQEHYQAFQRVFAEQALAIPLYYPLYTLVASDEISGIRLGLMGNGADRFRGIGAWHSAS